MSSLTDFNDGWLFEGDQLVRLPHTAVELPFSYFDEKSYQRAFTYQKRFEVHPDWQDKEVSLHFEGAMADARVSLNGQELCAHPDGYTPFEARLTDVLRPGENVIDVTIDGSENPDIPPFGGRIDYLTYAGIYREVWLKLTAPISIANVKIETPDVLGDTKSVSAKLSLADPASLGCQGQIEAVIIAPDGQTLAAQTVQVDGASVSIAFDGLTGIALWEIDNPALYTLRLRLTTNHGEDATETRFGFRSAEFTTDGFKLNGNTVQLRGLNRHQSFPYAGYALGKAAQVRDAEILKNELKLNMVRTSHYPQSTWFLDRCDELGLLVFEEIPGWQYIGGDKFKAESLRNVERMIRRDWNHPSIVIWGVRINESRDDHDFYVDTNRLAHDLDSTRPTGGVRCITDSELLEDVYTMNDFILGSEELGGNRPRTALRPQREVTGLDRIVPYLITEYGGHMYPTKSYDQEKRQSEHVRRHLEILDAAYGDPQIAGSVGWCAFDYNTHKDFGSGDRICHHGVMDMFREPKFAAYVYKSQCDPSDEPVLQPVTVWARGERNIGGVLPLIVLTNCEEVEIRFGKNPPKRFSPDREQFPHLPHPPVVIDRHHFSQEELGHWGMHWEDATFSAFVDGRKVKEHIFVADPIPESLEVVPDRTEIGVNECVRVMVRGLDQAGNKLPYMFEPVTLKVSGPGHRVGPETVPLRAGATGCWIVADAAGEITLQVTHDRFKTRSVTILASGGAGR